MHPVFRLLAIVALLFPFSSLRSQHPPPISAAHNHLHEGGAHACTINPNYLPVPHEGLHDVRSTFNRLTQALGLESADYSLELMRDKRGIRQINAMTCPRSRMIWVSVTAWERLHHHDAAMTLLLAHELAHAEVRTSLALRQDAMTVAEDIIMSIVTNRQLIEVAADQRAADLMMAAGYTIYEINAAAHFIMASDAEGLLTAATPTHPGGRDRLNLLTFYLARTYLPTTNNEHIFARR
ncbi:MAG: hypothetical protein AAF840_01960 [Bacteroidota bacterium]